MKNIKYFIFLLLLIPIKVNATMYFECTNGITPGKNSTCTITSDQTITSFKAKISASGATIKTNASSPFSNQTSGTNLHYTSVSGGKTIGTITITIPANHKETRFTFNLTDITYIVSGNTAEKEQNNKTISIGVSLPTTTTKKTTTTTKAGSTTKTTTTKKTTITTKPSSTTTTTTTKPVTEGDALTLRNLTIEGQRIQFGKYIYNYELTVLYEVESLNINAEPDLEGVTVAIDENASALEVGENIININLLDDKGNTNSYILTVTRLKEGEALKELSNDVTLKSLNLGKYTIDFQPTRINYDVTINSGTSKLTIDAQPNDANAQVTIEGNDNLKNGSEVKIIVTSESGLTNTYHLFITTKGIFSGTTVYIILGGVILLSLLVIIIKKSGSSKNKPTKAKPIGKIAPSKATPKPVVPTPVAPTPEPAEPAPVEVLDI